MGDGRHETEKPVRRQSQWTRMTGMMIWEWKGSEEIQNGGCAKNIERKDGTVLNHHLELR